MIRLITIGLSYEFLTITLNGSLNTPCAKVEIPVGLALRPMHIFLLAPIFLEFILPEPIIYSLDIFSCHFNSCFLFLLFILIFVHHDCLGHVEFNFSFSLDLEV